MSVLVAIPARYASLRYPGKPLVELKGATGVARSLVQRSWEAAQSVSGVDRVVVATDDDRIAEACTAFGAEVVMTSDRCRNGTERCAEVSDLLDQKYDIIVNLQGDAPLTPPSFVEALVSELQSDPSCPVATPVLQCSSQSLESFREDRKNNRVGATTAVFDHAGFALYFSKEVIPFSDAIPIGSDNIPVFHHVGVYAYRKEALATYPGWPQGRLELWEGLEQLRFMEMGTRVKCVEVRSDGREFWELNNPSDVEKIENILQQLNLP